MKKLRLVVVIMLLGLFLVPGTALAWDDCPKGLVDDPYPGECARYVDTDNDGICDHSQPAPEDRQVSTQSADELSDNPVDAPTSNNSDEIEPVDTLKTSSQQVAGARSDTNGDSKQKLFLAFGIVFAHLVGILVYVGYRKRKAN